MTKEIHLHRLNFTALYSKVTVKYKGSGSTVYVSLNANVIQEMTHALLLMANLLLFKLLHV